MSWELASLKGGRKQIPGRTGITKAQKSTAKGKGENGEFSVSRGKGCPTGVSKKRIRMRSWRLIVK